MQAGCQGFKFPRFHHYGSVVQLVRTPACHAGGRPFKSGQSRQGSESLSDDRFYRPYSLLNVASKGVALKGFVPVQNPISGDDAEVQGAAAAIICRISSVGRAAHL